jgi:hypothetical protein
MAAGWLVIAGPALAGDWCVPCKGGLAFPARMVRGRGAAPNSSSQLPGWPWYWTMGGMLAERGYPWKPPGRILQGAGPHGL